MEVIKKMTIAIEIMTLAILEAVVAMVSMVATIVVKAMVVSSVEVAVEVATVAATKITPVIVSKRRDVTYLVNFGTVITIAMST